MKTKIAIILIVLGIAVSFGAAKITKSAQPKKDQLHSTNTRTSEPSGGFVLEEH